MLKNFFSLKAVVLILAVFLSLIVLYSDSAANGNSRLRKLYDGYVKLGEKLRQNGEYNRAIDVYRDTLKIVRKTGEKKSQVSILIKLGILYWNEGILEKSTSFFREALSLSGKINLESEKEECSNFLRIYELYELGKKYRKEYRFKESIDEFNEAVALARAVNSKDHEVKCLRQLSITYFDLKNLYSFFSVNKQALEIARELNHRKEEGRCLNNMGLYYESLENYSQALEHYDKSLKIAFEIKNLSGQSISTTNISNIYCSMGNYEKSLEYMQKVLKIDRALKDNDQISIDFNNIGDIYRRVVISTEKNRNFKMAMKYFEKSLKLARREKNLQNVSIALNNLGFTSIDLENNSLALQYLSKGLERAEEIKDEELVGMILCNIGTAYFEQGMYKEAIEYYKESISRAYRVSARFILWEAYFGLGRSYEKIREISQALIFYKRAVDTIDRLRKHIFLDTDKAGFSRNKLNVYESFLNLLFGLHNRSPQEGFDTELFTVVEGIKAKAFLEGLEEKESRSIENFPQDIKSREKEISQQISEILSALGKSNIPAKRRKLLLEDLGEKEDEYLRLISRAKSRLAEFHKLVSPDPIRLEELQKQHLDGRTAIVEYFLGEERSYLFIITQNSFTLHELPPREEVESSVKAYLKSLSTPGDGKFRSIEASKRLYRELLFPLEEKVVSHIENLVIMPDGILYYLPFEALTVEDNYLVNKYVISYVPSSSILVALSDNKEKDRTIKDLLAIGNPDYMARRMPKQKESENHADVLRELYLNKGFDFSPLPFSEKEIIEISQFIPKERKEIYLGDEAREEVIKNSTLRDYKIIHFACHGFLDEKNPFRSALILSLDDSSKEDGFLQVREIYTLNLNADLVVLSACQTGKGKLEQGEGILGFPRIFFYAGAKSVITSLWKINDESTSEFMKFFYKYLSEGKSKSRSLQAAKLKMLDTSFVHPYYWAAFILTGDYQSLINLN